MLTGKWRTNCKKILNISYCDENLIYGSIKLRENVIAEPDIIHFNGIIFSHANGLIEFSCLGNEGCLDSECVFYGKSELNLERLLINFMPLSKINQSPPNNLKMEFSKICHEYA